MEVALSQRDHPAAAVNAHGIEVTDPYFKACWAPLVSPWTAHVVAESAELTREGRRHMSFDDFSAALNPEPADAAVRSKIVFGAMVEAQRAGLGSCAWPTPHQGTFEVYRHVPLLAEPQLQWLTDPALFAHVDAVGDVNRRLRATGAPPVTVPRWVVDRVGRADPTVRPLDPAAAGSVRAAIARLDSLSRGPSAPGVAGSGRPGPPAMPGPASSGLSL